MAQVSQDYQKLVLDDIKTYLGLSHPVKASLLERFFRRKLPISCLHPSPEDEFCDPAIGPSGEVINRYIEMIRNMQEGELAPLYVQKMSAGGYMLLDGHHRWFAAHRMGIRRLPVRILNIKPVEEIISRVAASEHSMCVSFDLDEVLLIDALSAAADERIPQFVRRLMGRTMRKSAPPLIRELQSMGFDVWVYTDRFLELSELQRMFRFYHIRVDGIVGGLKNPSARAALRKAFTDQFLVSVHVDNSGVVCVDTRTKEYETAEIGNDPVRWGSQAIEAVRKSPIVQAHLVQKS